MFRIIIIILITTIDISVQAQSVWNDYVIGKPIAEYFEAKRITAQEWGINYKTDFAGCVLSAETEQMMQDYEKSNLLYFEEIEKQYGENWQHYFNLDIQKKMMRMEAETDSSYWVETVVGKPNIAYFELKEKIAQTWGIRYKANYAGCELTEELRQKIEKGDWDGGPYQLRLISRFGENWEEELNREVEFELAKERIKIDPTKEKNLWNDYIIGKQNKLSKAYYNAKKEMVRQWGLDYKAVFVAPKYNKRTRAKLKKLKESDKANFDALEEEYGLDWKLRFELAIQKELAQKS